jgi:hypothetical protein
VVFANKQQIEGADFKKKPRYASDEHG